MKKCNMCGSFVSDKATQCPKCGVEIKEDIIPEVKVPEVHMPEVKEAKEEGSYGNYCPSCGNKLDADAMFCSKCGKNLNPNASFSSKSGNDDRVAKDLDLLRNDFAKKSTSNLVIAIVSFVLCCCGFVSLISLFGSINSLKKMNSLSYEVKNYSEYRSIRNKNIIALIISAIVTLYFAINVIDFFVNFDLYVDIYNSAYNDALNGGY